MLFQIEPDISSAYDTQMSGPEILDRSPVEILVDDGGTYVRAPRDRRRVAELLPHAAHDGGNDTFRLGLRLDGTALGERDGRDQRPAPRAEILGRELFAKIHPDVIVEACAGEVAKSSFPFV